MPAKSRCANLAILALALPICLLAEASGTAALTAAMGTLNLDSGTTGTSGGDLLWNGSTLTPQGKATAGIILGFGGDTGYAELDAATLEIFSSLFSTRSFAVPTAGLIVGVHTNGGNYAKVLVTSQNGGTLGLQFTTYSPVSGPGPSITAVENAATNLPPGLPNSGIAQGSLFVVKGAYLGPATYTQASSFPLPNSIGGTSVTVTVGGATVNAIMFYSLASQVAAILPSSTPVGTGTLKLTYNGQSATAPITVVENNIGIYTVSQSGSGDAVAFLNSDSQLITPTHTANPGDVVVFWGTGLGPVTFDETEPAMQADMTGVPLQVFIGGQQADIVFRGRNACCSSADSVYVRVPPGVSGCRVSVFMQIGNIVSNWTSIAVAQNGRTCTPAVQRFPVGGTGTYTSGLLYLGRSVSATSKSDSAGAQFSKVTYSSPSMGSQLDAADSYGSCSVLGYIGPPPSESTVKAMGLDAGPSIALAGPFGSKNLPRSSLGSLIFYMTALDQTATTLTPGQYTFTGTGGPDVGAFTANYTPPPLFTWTNQSGTATVNRANGLTVNWSGGTSSGYVIITGSSAGTAIGSFSCTARVSDSTFIVPPVVLLGLPPSGPSGAVSSGSLTVSASDFQTFPPPTGFDAALVGSVISYSSSVTYQ